MELSCVRRGGDLHVSKGPAFGLQALGSASQLLGAACVAQEWEGWRGPSLASDRGWRLEWMDERCLAPQAKPRTLGRLVLH